MNYGYRTCNILNIFFTICNKTLPESWLFESREKSLHLNQKKRFNEPQFISILNQHMKKNSSLKILAEYMESVTPPFITGEPSAVDSA